MVARLIRGIRGPWALRGLGEANLKEPREPTVTQRNNGSGFESNTSPLFAAVGWFKQILKPCHRALEPSAGEATALSQGILDVLIAAG